MITNRFFVAALPVGLLLACGSSVDAPSVTADDSTALPEAGATPRPDATPQGVESAAPIVSDAKPGVTDVVDSGPPESDAGFFGASRCASGSFLLCDDFEADAIDAKRWFYNPGNGGNASGYAAIDSMRAARGKHSLHFHTEMNPKGSGSQVKARDPQPLLANGFYLRAFMYIGQPIPDHHLNYFNVVAPGADGGMFNLGSLDGKLGIVEFGPHNGDHAVTADPLIVGRWFCVEWQVHPSTNEVRVWVDEAEVPALHVTDWLPSQFSEFFLELISYQGAYDIWIDELAYDAQRVGCRR
jgi:hypothetical protein